MDGIPEIVAAAYETLLNERNPRITAPLQVHAQGSGFSFEYDQPIDEPNAEGIASPVRLRVVIPESFPYAETSFFALPKDARGFAHQDAETGKLCLEDGSRTILDDNRLTTDFDRAANWMTDAAAGQLLRDGDPYELPDFSRRNLQEELRDKPTVYTNEEEATFAVWRDRIGQSGWVSFGSFRAFDGCFPRVFRDRERNIFSEHGFTTEAVDPKGRQLDGCWVLLSDLRFHRHRPPQTYGELRELFSRDGLDFDRILAAAWKCVAKSFDPCMVLVGTPIPRFVGEDPIRVHWQPLYVDGVDKQFKKQKDRRKKRKKPPSIFIERVNSGEFADNKPILWGRTENVSHGMLCARGVLPRMITDSKISVCGCGAIGSMVAEILARGGVRQLCLFDDDVFEIGNQCRHTLDGRHIGDPKASALAGRLQSCNPVARIRPFVTRLPLAPQLLEKPVEAASALLESDLVFDCALSEPGFQWLSTLLRRKRIPLATMFVNVHATVLTLALSGRQMACRETLRLLQQSIDKGEAPFSKAEYDPPLTEEEKVLPDLGCWHATFPALNSHIWSLAAIALDVLKAKLGVGLPDGGYACVIRRNEYTDDEQDRARPLMEVAWEKTFE